MLLLHDNHCAYKQVHFEGTTLKTHNDPVVSNPVWNSQFCFPVSDVTADVAISVFRTVKLKKAPHLIGQIPIPLFWLLKHQAANVTHARAKSRFEAKLEVFAAADK